MDIVRRLPTKALCFLRSFPLSAQARFLWPRLGIRQKFTEKHSLRKNAAKYPTFLHELVTDNLLLKLNKYRIALGEYGEILVAFFAND